MINVTINDKSYSFEKDMSVLEALKSIGIEVPTICYDARFETKLGICGMCAVVIDGKITKSCKTPISDGMIVDSEDNTVFENRQKILQKLIDNHYTNCLV